MDSPYAPVAARTIGMAWTFVVAPLLGLGIGVSTTYILGTLASILLLVLGIVTLVAALTNPHSDFGEFLAPAVFLLSGSYQTLRKGWRAAAARVAARRGYVLFDQVDRADPDAWGGKAHQLFAVAEAGSSRFDAPRPALVLTTPLFGQFLRSAGIDGELSRQLARCVPGDRDTVADASRQCQQLIEETPLPPRVRKKLERAYETLVARTRSWTPEDEDGHLELIVRSSFFAEGLSDLSFAGRFLSVRGVGDERQFEAAVRQCWVSAFNAAGLEGLAQVGETRAASKLAVLVHPFVEAGTWGVMFTRDPLSGAAHQLVVDWAELGGDGGSFTLQKATAAPTPIHGGLPEAPGLFEALAALSVEMRRLRRQASDVEWLWDGTKLTVVQARPATAIPAVRTWTRVAGIELPQVVATPLERSMGYEPDEILARSVGRPAPGGDRVLYVESRPYIDFELVEDLWEEAARPITTAATPLRLALEWVRRAAVWIAARRIVRGVDPHRSPAPVEDVESLEGLGRQVLETEVVVLGKVALQAQRCFFLADPRMARGQVQAPPPPARSFLGRLRAGRAKRWIELRDDLKAAFQHRAEAIRRSAVHIGERLVDSGVLRQGDDALFLSIEELRRAIQAGPDEALQEQVESRRRRHGASADSTPPATFLTSLQGERLPRRRRPAADGDEDGVLWGNGVSPGRAEGRVGENILVLAEPSPLALFQHRQVRAVICEGGGVVSHLAITSRELGIPMVANLPDARARLQPGIPVVVDGDTGQVTRA